MNARTARRITFAALALAGTLAGHGLTYVFAIGAAGHRSEHLAAAGHGYWGAAVWLAAAAVVCGILALVLSLSRTPAPAGASSMPEAIRGMVLVQVAGFSTLEVGERLISGVGLADLDSHQLLGVGLLVQVIVAVLSTITYRSLVRAAALIAALIRMPDRSGSARITPPLAALPPLRAAMPEGGWGLRGPPISDPV